MKLGVALAPVSVAKKSADVAGGAVDVTRAVRGAGRPKPRSKPKGPPCSSFTAATAVMLCNGTSKPISEIQEGDLVLTRNEDTGELSCWPAVSPYSSPNRALIDVELVDEHGNTEVLETTFDHPFYVLGEGWVRVEHLEVGDVVPTSNGQATVVGLAWKGQLATVYNFGVEQTRSYFVGETGAWVHNCWSSSVANDLSKASEALDNGAAKPSDVQELIDDAIDNGWEIGPLRRGSQKGNGMVLREMNEAGTDYTGRIIQWHPGGGHHGAEPYWKISGDSGTHRLGPQFD